MTLGTLCFADGHSLSHLRNEYESAEELDVNLENFRTRVREVNRTLEAGRCMKSTATAWYHDSIDRFTGRVF